jgi:transcriptional regulator with XRE-family HTH domain
MSGEKPTAPGGARLRALRETAGRSQLWVEAEAELGTGYLQRVEAGRVVQPTRPTLERIVAALNSRYSERKDLLALFGYLVATPIPDEADRSWAREVSARQLDEVPFPAYVLDIATTMIAWNAQFAHLLTAATIGLHPRILVGRPLLAHWFDMASPLAALVAAPETLLPALIRAMLHEVRQLCVEDWYDEWLTTLLALPRFHQYWTQVAGEHERVSAARALVPVQLAAPGFGTVQFRLATEPFTRDMRFRMVYLFPADADTVRRCAT